MAHIYSLHQNSSGVSLSSIALSSLIASQRSEHYSLPIRKSLLFELIYEIANGATKMIARAAFVVTAAYLFW